MAICGLRGLKTSVQDPRVVTSTIRHYICQGYVNNVAKKLCNYNYNLTN